MPKNRSPKRNCARYSIGWTQPETFSARTANCVRFCPAAKARPGDCERFCPAHETETLELRSRNAELEEILRKYAPMLLDAATTMGLAAKDTPSSGPVRAPSRWQQQRGVL